MHDTGRAGEQLDAGVGALAIGSTVSVGRAGQFVYHCKYVLGTSGHVILLHLRGWLNDHAFVSG